MYVKVSEMFPGYKVVGFMDCTSIITQFPSKTGLCLPLLVAETKRVNNVTDNLAFHHKVLVYVWSFYRHKLH